MAVQNSQYANNIRHVAPNPKPKYKHIICCSNELHVDAMFMMCPISYM